MPTPGFTFSLIHIQHRYPHHTTPHTYNTTLTTLALLTTQLLIVQMASFENWLRGSALH